MRPASLLINDAAKRMQVEYNWDDDEGRDEERLAQDLDAATHAHRELADLVNESRPEDDDQGVREEVEDGRNDGHNSLSDAACV